MLPEPVWEEFARRHGAELKMHSRFWQFEPYRYTIRKSDEFSLLFLWPVSYRSEYRITKTEFFFFLPPAGKFTFKVCRRGVMETLYYLFRKKIKTGDPGLDSDFIFLSDNPEMAALLAPELVQLWNCSRRFDFELEINEPFKPGLHIVIGKVLRKEHDIETFYKLGKTLQEKISRLVSVPLKGFETL